jgi:hypothetical protein
MNFDTLLETLENSGTEKTAAAQSTQGPDRALQAALQSTLAKSASISGPSPLASSPIDDLEKLAEEIAGTEKEAEVIHAANMGRAFADAAINEFSVANAKVAQFQAQMPVAPIAPAAPVDGEVDNAIKLAAEIGYSDAKEAVAETVFTEKLASASSSYEKDELIKIAAQAGREDLLIKSAAEKGYQDTQVKIAEAQYTQGENDALREVHKVASDEFLKGAQEANILIAKARQSQ